MDIYTLQGVLLDFVGNPNKSWGKPSDGNGNFVDLKTGKQMRRTPDQADINAARMNSGTYTPEQEDDFWKQTRQTECCGGTACFLGDPDDLPADIPEKICAQCGKTFRSVNTEKKVKCFNCCLEVLCLMIPSCHIRAYWNRDGWWLECSGDIGFNNETTFRWSNQVSHGNVFYQSIEVFRTIEGKVRKLIFLTVARETGRCYRVTFDLKKNAIRFARTDNALGIKNNDICSYKYAKFIKLKKLDDLALDLMVAMIPPWMFYAHYPRN